MSFFNRFRLLPLLLIFAAFSFVIRLNDTVGEIEVFFAAKPAQAQFHGVALDKTGYKPFYSNEIIKIATEAHEDESHEDEVHEEDEHSEHSEDDVASEAATDDDEILLRWRDASEETLNVSTIREELFEDIVTRRKSLDIREDNLVQREALLKAAERQIDQKYAELADLRGELETLLDKQSAEEKARITSLVKIYEGMKPKDAAGIFNTLDMEVLLPVAQQMSERRLAPILAVMDEERARTVTVKLAEEIKLPN